MVNGKAKSSVALVCKTPEAAMKEADVGGFACL